MVAIGYRCYVGVTSSAVTRHAAVGVNDARAVVVVVVVVTIGDRARCRRASGSSNAGCRGNQGCAARTHGTGVAGGVDRPGDNRS